MTWGNFTSPHILSLIIAFFLNIGLYFFIRFKSKQFQTVILTSLSFLGLLAIIYNLVMWNSPLEYLPLHLCSLNAIILPFAIISKNNKLGNLLILWSLGALVALVINNAAADFKLISFTFFFYYFPHVFECGIPLIMLKLGFFKLDKKYIKSTLLITLISYTLIHFVNIGLNEYFIKYNLLDYKGDIIQVNYMFSYYPDNPLLKLFYKVIPYRYWYMLLAVPIIILYLLLIYYVSYLIKKIKM